MASVMPATTFELVTADGPCATELVAPDGAGPWPVIVLCHDAAGQRPAMTELATSFAAEGYLVATPDLFHRSGPPSALLPEELPADPVAVRALFADPERRARFMRDFYQPALAYENLATTVDALLEHLAGRADTTGTVAALGYCMGGNAAFRLATVLGARLAATACIHAGGLVTDQADSPHLRCAAIRARVLVAGATADATFSDDARATLATALADAGVAAAVELYPGRHGFAVRDHEAHDLACTERHHHAVAALFAATLRA